LVAEDRKPYQENAKRYAMTRFKPVPPQEANQ